MAHWLGWLAAIMSLVVTASPALALETGQCAPAEQARRAIAAEQISPIIVGNRSGYGHPTALIFFANADGSKGYVILTDRPFGEQATSVCVQSVLRNIRLNDITNAGIPSWAKMPVDRPKATALCAKGGLGWQDSCRPHDTSLANLESNGLHVMLSATGTAINPRDNSIRHDQRITVAVDPVQSKGLFEAATEEGANYMLSAYLKVNFTQHGLALLTK